MHYCFCNLVIQLDLKTTTLITLFFKRAQILLIKSLNQQQHFHHSIGHSITNCRIKAIDAEAPSSASAAVADNDDADANQCRTSIGTVVCTHTLGVVPDSQTAAVEVAAVETFFQLKRKKRVSPTLHCKQAALSTGAPLPFYCCSPAHISTAQAFGAVLSL